MQVREFFEKNKLVSNDLEMSNSARNSKKKFGDKWRFLAVLPPFFLNIREICPKSKLLPFLTNWSEVKTKLRNHGVSES